uniref:DNA polymerase delta subunit 4 n=1 Tax=Equus asinus TaxID=9793 RepID=A0A9L0IPU9_EQUAS
MFVCLLGWRRGVIPWNWRTSSLCLSGSSCLPVAGPRLALWPQPSLTPSQQLSLSCPLACLSSSPQSPPSPPAWVAAMGRKRLITDSYPVVKRREGPAGHCKGELAPDLGEEPQTLNVDEAELELLRQFDLAWQYGPCTGITRLQRWHRAKQMGLEPPLEVYQPLASLSPLNHHLRPPARYPRTSGHKHEPVAALQLSSAVENVWQERVSKGRKEAESGSLHGSALHLTSRLLEPRLRASAAEAEHLRCGEWSLRTKTWP